MIRNRSGWVENTTHGEITDLLIPGSITKNTKLAIANAAYFKGTWQSKFKPEETKKEIFYVSNERQEFVDMMHVEGTFNHAANEKLGCHILELPYGGQDEAFRVSMFVFLPPPNPTHWDKLLARLTSAIFPRPVDMKTVLGRGMGKLFENSANFSGFSKKVQVGEVLVKFKITVNEEGATVASATVEFSFRSSRPDNPAMFHCNHPFIFVIWDYATQAELFNEVYHQPE
ncbi:hypothetical protein pipiens_002927 [Culex pipiens pipiens]|uniref:Serpin domain-containing protein n=1 Tax=Culex pipiens pipiens TaxID=38569 RepID=A0ABD1D620_CULPP